MLAGTKSRAATSLGYRTSLLGFGFAVVIVPAAVAADAKRAPPPTMKDLAGSWFGYTEDTLDAYRLDLGADGTGRCAYTFMGQPPVFFSVTHWSLQGTKITVDLRPFESRKEGMQMKGSFFVEELRLKVYGFPSRSWKLGLSLHRQEHLSRDLDLLNEALRPAIRSAG